MTCDDTVHTTCHTCDHYTKPTIRAWPIHWQHWQSGPVVGQLEPSEQSAIDDNRWPVRADVSLWGYSPNSPSHGLYRPPRQHYSRFCAVSALLFKRICLWWDHAVCLLPRIYNNYPWTWILL